MTFSSNRQTDNAQTLTGMKVNLINFQLVEMGKGGWGGREWKSSRFVV